MAQGSSPEKHVFTHRDTSFDETNNDNAHKLHNDAYQPGVTKRADAVGRVEDQAKDSSEHWAGLQDSLSRINTLLGQLPANKVDDLASSLSQVPGFEHTNTILNLSWNLSDPSNKANAEQLITDMHNALSGK